MSSNDKAPHTDPVSEQPANTRNGDDPEFEKEAERAEEEAALDKELKETFPTSDPPSSWAGGDLGAQQGDDESPE
jgi:hypothetical protein